MNYIYLEAVCPLFCGFNPPKQGLFQSKHFAPFGFQVYIPGTQMNDPAVLIGVWRGPSFGGLTFTVNDQD